MRASAVVEWRSGTVPLVAVRVRSLPTRYRSLGSGIHRAITEVRTTTTCTYMSSDKE